MSKLLKRLSTSLKGKKTDTTTTTQAPEPASTSSATTSTPAAPPTTEPAQPTSTLPTTTTPTTTTMSSAPKIAIVIHSLWGHVKQLADKVEAGAKAAGADVTVYRFSETLPDEVLTKMHAPKDLLSHLPEITAADLTKYDGFLFGFGTRYGRTPAQVSTFFDTTGGLWASGGLVGKFGGIFTSTASQHGGQETTALTTIPFFAHHGITFVPIGYQFPQLLATDKVANGSAYGAATLSGGDGSVQPTEGDLAVAEGQGKYFATTVGHFVRGKAAASA
ncbi:hypothetical protein CF327_g6250 [Tilletia walkeri]|nr:hypothetical protein CF327_g6250 [Tilletia walkeri]